MTARGLERVVFWLCTAVLVGCGSGGDTDDGAAADADRGEPEPITGTATGPCGAVLAASAAGALHVDPGTEMTYGGVPPVSGKHWANWEDIAKPIYVVDERPDISQLVHSQEHGWTIVWYDASVDTAELETLVNPAAEQGAAKFVFMPWTEADGAPFPDGAHIAMTHWGVDGGETEYRQFCASPDAAAIAAFSLAYPATDSREPNAP